MRKPRSDSKLLALPPDQQEQLSDWMRSNLPYRQIRALVAKEFGLQTSLAALCHYYESVVSAQLLAHRARARAAADDLARDAAQHPGAFDQATLDAIKQTAFELAIRPNSDPRDVKQLFTLVLKSRDQDLKTQDVQIKLRRLQLLEAAASEAKAKLASVASKGGLSPETVAQIEEAAKLL